MNSAFHCRENCGACCIIPSISSFIPGMPGSKAGGVRCIHLTDEMRCSIFNHASRPSVCKGFKAEKLICGNNRNEAAQILSKLEGIDFNLNNL